VGSNPTHPSNKKFPGGSSVVEHGLNKNDAPYLNEKGGDVKNLS